MSILAGRLDRWEVPVAPNVDVCSVLDPLVHTTTLGEPVVDSRLRNAVLAADISALAELDSSKRA
jgi:hypothetical protein